MEKETKKKGFTLIELLAIIVILAIIAVITVPIILNIIEKSKKGAAQDSAHGYKDAVQKSYLNNAISEGLGNKLNGEYLITETGNLTDIYGDPAYDITVSGTIPSGGFLNIVNNIITDGCIQVNEYAVNIEDGKVLEPIKGTCGDTDPVAPDPVVYSCSDSNYTPDSESWYTTTTTGEGLYITGFSDQHPADVTDIKFPCTIGGTQVVGVNPGAFARKGITSVVIPQGFVDIKEGSFSSNNITSLAIPSSVTSIRSAAFSDNKIQKLTLNYGLQEIQSVAFVGNRIKELSIPSSVTTIEGGAFNGNQLEDNAAFIYDRSNSSKIISYAGKNKNVTIPSNVSTIGNMSFMSCGITNVTIPNSVTTIENQAFDNNKLKTVVIPNSVVNIGAYAFRSNNLEEVTIGTGVLATNSQSAMFLKGNTGTPGQTSNPNLRVIHNLSGQSFNWASAINFITTNGPLSGYTFATGTVPNTYGDVTILGE